MGEKRSHRSFVSYMDRSREYYAAQGYTRPYAWACHREVPFAPLKKRLSELRVGLITTAGLIRDGEGQPEAGSRKRYAYAEPASPPPRKLYTDDLFWDDEATHTDDVDSFLPVNRLAELAAAGRIGSASPRFYGVPTDYSQRNTVERDAPRILQWCREDNVDAVLLSAL